MIFTWHEYVNGTWRGQRITAREEDLLFILIARRGFVAREDIIEHIWPNSDKEPENAGGMVSMYVSKIRMKFGFGCSWL